MRLGLNGLEFAVQTIDDLRSRLVAVRQAHWVDVDLGETEDQGPDGTFFGLLMLTHDDRAFLLYVRYEGDAGFTSRDPAYDGPQDTVLDFRLSNGQSDIYPACWTIPLDDALRALEYALVHRAPAPWVTWHDDSVLGG